MPYASVNDVPSSIPEGKRSQFRQVFNSVFADTKDEGKAMAAAYSAIKKAQYATDIFTTEGEAKARSMDMGLDGAIHVSTYDGQAVYMPAESHESYLAYYLPEGAEEGSDDDENEPEDMRLEALRVIVQEVMKEEFAKAEYQGEKVTLNKPRRTKGGPKKFEVFVQDGDKVKRVTFGDPNMEIRRDDPKARANFRARHSCDSKKDKTSAGYWSCRMWEANTTVSETTKSEQSIKILKIDEEQRIIYGWASVTTYKGELVVDLQGDVIKTDTLHKSINEFMKGVRVGKLNHSGEQVGQIVHSFPMSKEICAALEIQSEKEGWITGYHVTDDTLWEKVKAGDYAEFSIGGRAQKQEL
jgi:hypothetical protein